MTEIQNAISRLVKGKTVLIIVTNVYTKLAVLICFVIVVLYKKKR